MTPLDRLTLKEKFLLLSPWFPSILKVVAEGLKEEIWYHHKELFIIHKIYVPIQKLTFEAFFSLFEYEIYIGKAWLMAFVCEEWLRQKKSLVKAIKFGSLFFELKTKFSLDELVVTSLFLNKASFFEDAKKSIEGFSHV